MTGKKLEKRLYEFGHLFKVDLYRSEDLAEGVAQRLDQLQSFYDKAMARVLQIRRNASLTARGKSEQFAKLKGELATELAEWSKVADGYDEQAKRIEAEAHPTRHPKDDAAHELRQREIRDALRAMDPAAAEAEFLAAAESGKSELVSAVLYSPVKFNFVTEDLAQKVLRQQWERESPADADKLADLQRAQQEIQSALRSVGSDLARQGVDVLAAVRGRPLAA